MSSDSIAVSPNVRLSSYVKTHIIVDGLPVYLGAEMADDLLPGETFEEMSERVSGAVIEHLLAQITEARTITKRTSK